MSNFVKPTSKIYTNKSHIPEAQLQKKQPKIMEQEYFENKTFEKIDFTLNPPVKGEYEYCRFLDCDFSNADLNALKFVDCVFEGCNLSMAKLGMTAFRNVKFSNCKLLGLHFENCNPLGLSVSFENCNLSLSSFYRTRLKKMIFKNLKLHDVDFTESDLSGSVFEDCDLTGATFENTNIEKADFRTSFNFSIDPATNRVKKARFSLSGLPGLLNRFDIEIDY